MSSLAGTAALVRLALRRDRIVLAVFVVVLVVLVAASASATVGLYPDRRLARRSRRRRQQRHVDARAVRPHPRRVVHRRPVHLQDGHHRRGRRGHPRAVRRRAAHARRGGDGPPRAARRDGRWPASAADRRTARGRRRQSRVGRRHRDRADRRRACRSPVRRSWAWASPASASSSRPWPASPRSWSVAHAPPSGLAGVVLGVAYLLRAIGDASPATDSAGCRGSRPSAGGSRRRPYAGDRWWVLVLLLGFAVVLAALAYVLAARRDFAAGLLPDRPGPADGRREPAQPAGAGLAPAARRLLRLGGRLRRDRRGGRRPRLERRRLSHQPAGQGLHQAARRRAEPQRRVSRLGARYGGRARVGVRRAGRHAAAFRGDRATRRARARHCRGTRRRGRAAT